MKLTVEEQNQSDDNWSESGGVGGRQNNFSSQAFFLGSFCLVDLECKWIRKFLLQEDNTEQSCQIKYIT